MSDVDDLTRDAAQLLGMKVREVASVEELGDGRAVITTHDGVRTLVGEAAAPVEAAEEKPAEKPKARAKRS